MNHPGQGEGGGKGGGGGDGGDDGCQRHPDASSRRIETGGLRIDRGDTWLPGSHPSNPSNQINSIEFSYPTGESHLVAV